MTLQPGELAASGNSYEYQRHAAALQRVYGDESAEALRRRADSLLDEMMLGSADLGAGALVSPVSAAGDAGWPSYDADHPAGVADRAADRPVVVPRGHSAEGGNGALSDGSLSSDEANGSHGSFREYPASSALPGEEPRATRVDQSESAAGPGRAKTERGLISAEERYVQMTSGLAASAALSPVSSADSEFLPGLGPVVRRQSPLVSTMTVGTRGSARSSLLPRSTDVDAAAMEQEIRALMSEVSASLPVGHEAAERSRHLLNKAQNLLQSDPTRSAEVEYYLQQVRRIVQRARQTRVWSNLYRNRLNTYLVGWILLALVVIAALMLFHEDFVETVQNLLGLSPESLIMAYVPMVTMVVFAGALGAASSVLWNMHRHSRQEYGYFDRKYGLRGLLLPLIGLFLGFLLALLYAALTYFIQAEPYSNRLVEVVPVLLAFFVGFSQEWLYGAR